MSIDYRMYNKGAAAGENVVESIQKHLEETEQVKVSGKLVLDFIGFEAEEGTEFKLNNQKDIMKVPSSGNFITPYNGSEYMKVYSLKFENDFSGNIYYIL